MTLNRYVVATALGLFLLMAAGHVLAGAGDTTTVTVTGTLVDAPECTVNGNNTVLVDFGDNIVTRKIDGVNYTEPMRVTLNCNSYVKDDMILTIRAANGAGFGTGLVGTDVKGLGIRLMADGQAISAGDPISFTYPTVPSLSAVLVAEDNTTLTSRPFTGTGTLVIQYQ